MLLGVTLAVGLLSAVLFYVDASAAHMTQAAIADPPVDMQVVAMSADGQLATIETQLAAQPDVKGVLRFSLAGFTSGQLTGGDRAAATTPGALIALTPDYFTVFARPQLIQGQFIADGVLVSKDMATNLGAKPGDAIQLNFPAPAPPYVTKVSGIADLSGADLLFAPTDLPHRQAAFNPPSNVAIMNLDAFNAKLRTALLAAPVRPVIQSATFGAAANGAQANGAANNVVSSNESPVSEQLHIRIDRSRLPGDPIQAQASTEQLRLVLERQAPGQIRVLNNLSDTIEGVKADVLWAKILVVFLAGPGILLAAYLSRYAIAGLIAAQRRELALLRARGATPNQVVSLIAVIGAMVALIGVALGIPLGLATSAVVAPGTVLVPGNSTLLLKSALVSLAGGMLIALGAMILPTRSLYLSEVQAGRRRLAPESVPPLWQRFYIDVACLIAGLAILTLTYRNGFTPVVNDEGNATQSLSLVTFLSPTLIWLGAALLLLRIGGRLLTSGAGWMRRVLTAVFGPADDFAARGMARRSGGLQQVALIIALAVAFGVSLSGFAATYRQQQRVDAELTLGADVRVTPDKTAPQTAAFAETLRSTPGVVAASPLDLNVAYVGSELQDIFGVNVASLRQAATVADSFFLDAPADTVLSRLAATPDGIVVSEETAKDYSIVAGDHVNIRLQRPRDGQFFTVELQVVGVAREFPTAPKDSFLVVNQAFLHQVLDNADVATFLVRTKGNPAQVAAAIRTRFPASPLTVESINMVTARLTRTLATVSLDGLTRIEWSYTMLIAALALTIFLIGLLAERQNEYATLTALGATPTQLNAFLLSEAATAGATGIVIGSIVGLMLTQVLVIILRAIFDPPPSHMLMPVSAIGVLLALVAAGLAVSMVIAVMLLRRLQPAQVLRAT